MRSIKKELFSLCRVLMCVSIALFVNFNTVIAQSSCLLGNESLATARNFAVLAGSAVTNTGSTNLVGDLGISPSSALTGFSDITLSGTLHQTDAVANQAQNDLTTRYNSLASLPFDTDLSGQNLGGLVLTPGVYRFSSSAQLTGQLTLDTLGNPNSVFVFQIGSALTTASNSSVNVIGGPNNNIFWQIGSSATLGTTTEFVGNIIAFSSITLNTGANIRCGSALARNGAVTLDTNIIEVCNAGCVVPVCGDGLLHSSEACDDGNLNNNDSCNNLCQSQTQACDGVFGSSAVLDRCNVCNGDGQSCISCVSTNNSARQRILDNISPRLRNLVAKTVREILIRGRRSNQNISFVNNLNTQAQNISMQSWILVWSIPSITNACVSSPFCVTVSHQAILNSYRQNIDQLYFLTSQAATKLRTITNQNSFSRRIMANAKTQQNFAVSLIALTPGSNTICN